MFPTSCKGDLHELRFNQHFTECTLCARSNAPCLYICYPISPVSFALSLFCKHSDCCFWDQTVSIVSKQKQKQHNKKVTEM